jgi:four helix bundle protein
MGGWEGILRYRSFEVMPVWRKATQLAENVHRLTEGLPRKEEYGLISQIRRSALSVSGNLAEGFGRQHVKEKLNFYSAARGSLCETKSHLIHGRRVGYFLESDLEENGRLVAEIWRGLNSLIASLRNRR